MVPFDGPQQERPTGDHQRRALKPRFDRRRRRRSVGWSSRLHRRRGEHGQFGTRFVGRFGGRRQHDSLDFQCVRPRGRVRLAARNDQNDRIDERLAGIDVPAGRRPHDARLRGQERRDFG